MRIFGVTLGLYAIAWTVLGTSLSTTNPVVGAITGGLSGYLANEIRLWAFTYAWYMEHRRKLWRTYHICNWIGEYDEK